MAILEAVAEEPMRPKGIAQKLGLKWTTAYRSITYLREHGFLTRDDATGLYRIGPRLYFVGSSYVRDLQIVEASRAYLKAAVEATGAAAQLVERHGDKSVVLFAVEAQTILVPQATTGFHFPLHCGSKGHVLLAHASPDFIDHYLEAPLERLTPYTITDSDALRARLDEVRRRGFAMTERDIRPTSASVAAPIWDAAGRVHAAVTLITNVTELERQQAKLIEILVDVAHALSKGEAAAGAVVSSTDQ
jgi:DNA-binding IclR family transcriptional regulator